MRHRDKYCKKNFGFGGEGIQTLSKEMPKCKGVGGLRG